MNPIHTVIALVSIFGIGYLINNKVFVSRKGNIITIRRGFNFIRVDITTNTITESSVHQCFNSSTSSSDIGSDIMIIDDLCKCKSYRISKSLVKVTQVDNYSKGKFCDVYDQDGKVTAKTLYSHYFKVKGSAKPGDVLTSLSL